MGDFKESGLSTPEALNRLQADINQVLLQFEFSQKARKSRSWVRDTLHYNSQYTTINLISLLFILTLLVILMVTYIISQNAILVYQVFFVLFMVIIGTIINLNDNRLRHNEISRRVKMLINTISSAKHKVRWVPENYPNLLTPFSPCITLQWTYRDNKLVNLPWALLVRGDVILIRPGQISPGYCESLEKSTEYSLLHAKEVYGPSLQHANELFNTPKSRQALENKKFRLLETPYLDNLKIALEQALDRPVSIPNQQRHFLMVRIIEWIMVPIILALILIANAVKYICTTNFIITEQWWDILLLTPISTILPLLPIVFPIAWNLLNYLGTARFKIVFDATSQMKRKQTDFEDKDNSNDETFQIKYGFHDIWIHVFNMLKGNEEFFLRSANILHVLGSLTALCCVDKKGILSWPNPTAEKVFFLRNTENLSQTSSLANLGDLSTDADGLRGNTGDNLQNKSCYSTTTSEVLDLTHDHNDPFKLQFDDTGWYKNLNSLKPLGLAILLNTCNIKVQEDYTKFCSHITCEAMYNENLIPVTNRRCLCELAKIIGFLDQAEKIFSLEQHLSTYRKMQTETARRDNKYARSLHLSTKLKFPFPHMFAVVVKEKSTGSMQLLSQGTADMILDSCIDYWDGYDLCPLTNSDRKKIQDFYQRCSLTAYCTAFSYRPLHKTINEKLSHTYLELPSDSKHLYVNHRSPTSIHCDCRTVLEPRIKHPISQSYSTDSLLYNDSPISDINDVDSCFEIQCNQVFIGMVTMQYQAQLDMVHLIEELERACIRFVHFSKENELRSRVFSEKMGLESGWNCHISLLSERNRRESGPSECWANNGTARVCSRTDLPRHTRTNSSRKLVSDARNVSTLDALKTLSYSAPSAINLDRTVVKFVMEQSEPLVKCLDANNRLSEDRMTSQENIQINCAELNATSHEWQSLSCLTDSTEQSAPINFDMSNRAKLPRGIDKIRPHIENIDNVPLLVSLFTDCTASTTKEMLKVMQDYDEIICVMGSSANSETMGIFMQADASIAVEPLYPQMCQKTHTFKPAEYESISPIQLSRALNSIACSLSIKRENHLSIFRLIIESRHYMHLLWNAVQFWLCSCVSISIMQLLTAMLMLPSMLTVGQVLWLSCVIIPCLSVSLVGTAVDPEIAKAPQNKKVIGFNTEAFTFIIWCYGAKFVPMILSVLLSFSGTLASYCTDLCFKKNCTCTFFYLPSGHDVHTNRIDLWSAQNMAVIILVFHLITISTSFVHREYIIFKRSPHRNYLWLSTVVVLLIMQLIFILLSISHSSKNYENYKGFEIANLVIVFAMLSPLLTLIVNELIKMREIKTNLRYQRRARLDFGTKLGMNSPF